MPILLQVEDHGLEKAHPAIVPVSAVLRNRQFSALTYATELVVRAVDSS